MTADEIRSLPLFAGVSDRGASLLASYAELEAEPGQVLVLPGDLGTGMFVVVDGTVDVELHDGHVSVGPGAAIGELALLVDGSGRVARARAATRVRCLCVPRDGFESLLETEPTFTRGLLDLVARRLHAVLDA